MTTSQILQTPLSETEIEKYFDRLWPICRSISGNGLRESFHILKELMPLDLIEYPTGKEVFDWTIPNEWNITDAYILTPDGEKICDFKKNNLHIVNYSIPFEGEVDWAELSQRFFTIENQPDAIPYITSYYKETWGFCIDYNTLQRLPKTGKYKVVIQSQLAPGSVTVGHCILPGESQQEIVLSTYLCHPSMANNELSGPLCMAFLYRQLAAMTHRKYTYRFIMAPETIGVIAYLSDFGSHMKNNMLAGYVMTCCGDEAPYVFKQSKHATGLVERATAHYLKHAQLPHQIIPFAVGGSDERQYCSPGFNLPMGSITRSMYHRYSQYHTSLDNKEFISFKAMADTVTTYLSCCLVMENNVTPQCLVPFGEPRMGKRNLLPSSIEPNDKRRQDIDRMFHLISWSDGTLDLLEIAEKRNESLLVYLPILQKLIAEKLIAI